ncbi:M20/M25/M40 family metallo-hydrolase [Leptobacterium flavescens]|uniref:M20/M25/M40 family metallo-hydrolase n=1 Tax=Leptobacterium flavescens TaxID=472055 RepID=A0A6P0UPB0_9FLAO|nr:M20/M25/M40 family metallo-hydrolase [Leptobacterium flavescens]NER15005.1 M20/M25/M40 family metallo-hydrolase [Leptobacterium flavescens]
MKKIFLLLLIAVVGCKSTDVAVSDSANNAVKQGSNKAVANFSKESSVKAIMEFLASDKLSGRDTGSEGIEEAAAFIEGKFKAAGIKPYFDTYRDNFEVKGTKAFNVVGYLEGNDPQLKNEFIVIGAHYDHIGKGKEVNGDVIANGANDNASGTTAVLELASYFGKKKGNKRSIIFALFSAEEKGLLGSKHLAKKLKNEGLNLYSMVNFEMIGVPMVGKDYLAYVTGYKKSNMADEFNKYAGKKLIGFLPTAEGYNLFQRSDNYPFHAEFNVPSQTVCTFDFTNFNHYHQVGDEASLMDFKHMAHVINEMIPVLEGMDAEKTKTIRYN